MLLQNTCELNLVHEKGKEKHILHKGRHMTKGIMEVWYLCSSLLAYMEKHYLHAEPFCAWRGDQK